MEPSAQVPIRKPDGRIVGIGIGQRSLNLGRDGVARTVTLKALGTQVNGQQGRQGPVFPVREKQR